MVDVGPGLLESIWRYRFLVALITILGGLGGFLYAAQQPPIYEASARLLLKDPRPELFADLQGAASLDLRRYVRNQVEVIRTGIVYPTASELVDGRWSATAMADLVQAEADPENDLLIITASEFSGEGAAALANAVAEAYGIHTRAEMAESSGAAIAELRETNSELREDLRSIGDPADDAVDAAAEAERTATVTQITNNESLIAQLGTAAAMFDDGVEIMAPAVAPEQPVRPRPKMAMAAGVLLSFALAGGLAWWRHSTSHTVDRSTDATAMLGAPLLGEIPDFNRSTVTDDVPMASAPLSPAAEAYQFVISAFVEDLEESSDKAILVTSALPGDGKTTTALNLAVAAEKDGRAVILVDADGRKLGLTKRCKTNARAGLFELSSNNVPFESARSWIELGKGTHVSLVSAGEHVEDPAGYFRTPSFRHAMRRVRERADLMIVDSPPLLAVSETVAIAGQVDGIVLVVNRGTPHRTLAEVRRRLDMIGTPLVGYVFNRALPRRMLYEYANSYILGEQKRWGRAHRPAGGGHNGEAVGKPKTPGAPYKSPLSGSVSRNLP